MRFRNLYGPGTRVFLALAVIIFALGIGYFAALPYMTP